MALLTEAISESRRLCDLGHYDDAIAKLQPLANEMDGVERLRVASELSDVLQAQGYLSTALETLERVIHGTPSEYRTHSACLRRRIEACLLEQSVKASFNGVVERARGILDEVPASRDVDDFDIDLVRPASFLHPP